MFKPEIFSDIKEHTNNYVIFKQEEIQRNRNNPDYVYSVWQEITVESLKALFGINILTGLNPLQQYKLYMNQNDFIGKSGVKNTMTYRRHQKLTQYLYVSDRTNEPVWNSADHYKLYKISPMFNMAQNIFAECYKPGQNQTIDEGMIVFKGRLRHVQYLPAKHLREEYKVWMCCDADTAYLHQFEVYLGQQQNSEFGLEYDVVMKLCKDISGKNHHVHCDNLFTSVQLLKDLLACKTYCNGTIQVNKKYLPKGICKPSRMIHSAYKSYQDGSSNLVATVSQHNRIIWIVSKNSNPKNVVHTDRRLGPNVIQVNQPQNIQQYKRYMNGVDGHGEMCMEYDVGCFRVKASSGILWTPA